jgi:hypothetical protein
LETSPPKTNPDSHFFTARATAARERDSGFKHLQLLAGAPVTAFWAANYIADMAAFSLPGLGIVGLVAAAGRRLPSLQVRFGCFRRVHGVRWEGVRQNSSNREIKNGRLSAHFADLLLLKTTSSKQGARLVALATILWAFGAAGLSTTYMLHPLFAVSGEGVGRHSLLSRGVFSTTKPLDPLRPIPCSPLPNTPNTHTHPSTQNTTRMRCAPCSASTAHTS